MALEVIAVGFGRTATMSLRMALNQLGVGPCYHMENVLSEMPQRVPDWNAALDGAPDWDKIYDGFNSAVDWPTAAFWRELSDHYPDAKIILSSRSAESWWNSISQTILAVLTAPEKWPEPQRDWLEMCERVCIGRSLNGCTNEAGAMAAFNAHETAVKSTISANRLLVHQAKDGWEPLCAFLGKPVPSGAYPRSNDREEFFELMAQGG